MIIHNRLSKTPALDRKALSLRFVYEFARKLPIPMPTGLASGMLSFRQWLYSVYGEDITTAQKHRSIFQQYHRILDTLEEILQENEYLGGEYPSLVDFGFAGPLFRHCASDPTPRKIMYEGYIVFRIFITNLRNLGNKGLQVCMNG